MSRHALGKLPDTPAGAPAAAAAEGRRRRGVPDSVSWSLPERVSSHFEGPGGGSQGVGGTVRIRLLPAPRQYATVVDDFGGSCGCG